MPEHGDQRNEGLSLNNSPMLWDIDKKRFVALSLYLHRLLELHGAGDIHEGSDQQRALFARTMQMLDRGEDASCLDLDWSETLRELETFIQTDLALVQPNEGSDDDTWTLGEFGCPQIPAHVPTDSGFGDSLMNSLSPPASGSFEEGAPADLTDTEPPPELASPLPPDIAPMLANLSIGLEDNSMVAGETRPSDDSGYNNQGILPQGPKKKSDRRKSRVKLDNIQETSRRLVPQRERWRIRGRHFPKKIVYLDSKSRPDLKLELKRIKSQRRERLDQLRFKGDDVVCSICGDVLTTDIYITSDECPCDAPHCHKCLSKWINDNQKCDICHTPGVSCVLRPPGGKS